MKYSAIEGPASPGFEHPLCLNDLEFHFCSIVIEADQQLAIGVYRERIITAATADNDFSEENPDFRLDPTFCSAGADNCDRYITVIDVAALARALLQWQAAGGQAFQLGFQGVTEFGGTDCG